MSQALRGIYYALQDDLVNTTKWFSMALGVCRTNPDIHMNYAASLCRLGQHEQAVKMAIESITMGNYTPQSLHNLLLSAYYADDHAVLSEWLPKYEKLAGKHHAVASWLQEDAEDEAEIRSLGDEIRNGPFTPWEQVKKELGL
jgi:Tfp pilus assembly protein PilF